MFKRMFDNLKFYGSAFLGLALGVALALPLFWIGVKSSVGAIEQEAYRAFAKVDQRQQDMADECLRLQMDLKAVGFVGAKRDFTKVEVLRSRLAGSGDFDDQVEVSEELEQALVNIGSVYQKTMASSKRVAHCEPCSQFGLDWEPMMRYLVDEEFRFTGKVEEFNRILQTNPVPFVIDHQDFGAVIRDLVLEVRGHVHADLSEVWAWVKFSPRWLWAKVSRASVMPEFPQLPALAPLPSNPLFSPLPLPSYVAKAPIPEEDYPEIQYDRKGPNMADVTLGQDKAVLDERSRTPFVAPVATIQKTATYR